MDCSEENRPRSRAFISGEFAGCCMRRISNLIHLIHAGPLLHGQHQPHVPLLHGQCRPHVLHEDTIRISYSMQKNWTCAYGQDVPWFMFRSKWCPASGTSSCKGGSCSSSLANWWPAWSTSSCKWGSKPTWGSSSKAASCSSSTVKKKHQHVHMFKGNKWKDDQDVPGFMFRSKWWPNWSTSSCKGGSCSSSPSPGAIFKSMAMVCVCVVLLGATVLAL